MDGENKKKISAGKVIRIIVLVICLGVFFFSAYKLWNIFRNYEEINEVYGGTADKYTEMFEKHTLPQVKFDELKKINEDVVGWIYIEDTDINYPVLIGDNNDEYIYSTMYKEYLVAGSIFLDYRCAPDFTDKNTIIYGHKMKNGSMFGKVPKYDDEEFLKAHPYIYILLPDGTYQKYEVFSIYRINVKDPMYALPTRDDDSFARTVESINSQNNYKDTHRVTVEDKIITLSTCTYDLSETERIVVSAYLVESKKLDY